MHVINSNYDRILINVDCLIFGFENEELKILLFKREIESQSEKWSIVGGFLKNNESLNQAANRILKRLTGLDDIYMEQFYTYDNRDITPLGRTISIGYYALINIEEYNKDLMKKYSTKWFNVNEIPNLLLNHEIIIKKAIRMLRYISSNKPISFQLLPEKFTMKQLHKLYESILGTKLDKRNFISKIKALNILIKLDEKDMESSKKGSFLYIFDKSKFNEKALNGFVFKL